MNYLTSVRNVNRLWETYARRLNRRRYSWSHDRLREGWASRRSQYEADTTVGSNWRVCIIRYWKRDDSLPHRYCSETSDVRRWTKINFCHERFYFIIYCWNTPKELANVYSWIPSSTTLNIIRDTTVFTWSTLYLFFFFIVRLVLYVNTK